MKHRKYKKIIVIAASIFVVAQSAWLIFFYRDVNRNYIETTAVVVRMGYAGKTKQYPIYEITERAGNKITVDDYTSGDCGYFNFPCRLLQPDIGDKVTAYYKSGKPENAMFMTGNFLAGDVRFVPITIVMTIGLTILIAWVVRQTYREYKKNYIK